METKATVCELLLVLSTLMDGVVPFSMRQEYQKHTLKILLNITLSFSLVIWTMIHGCGTASSLECEECWDLYVNGHSHGSLYEMGSIQSKLKSEGLN